MKTCTGIYFSRASHARMKILFFNANVLPLGFYLHYKNSAAVRIVKNISTKFHLKKEKNQFLLDNLSAVSCHGIQSKLGKTLLEMSCQTNLLTQCLCFS